MRRALSLSLACAIGTALLAAPPAATAQEIWRPQSGSRPAVEPATDPAAIEPGREPRPWGGGQQPPQRRSQPDPYPSGGSQSPYSGSPPAVDPDKPVKSPPVFNPDRPVKSPPSPRVSPPSPKTPRGGPTPQPPVVGPGWPIKRPLNPVIVRPRYDDRRRHDDWNRYGYPYPYFYSRPFIYLPLIPFGGYYVSQWDDHYWQDRLLWEDAITIYGDEGWVEFTLDCGARGERLWIEVRDGRARIDWAEIVFDDGYAQVVDFADRSLAPGLYGLLEMTGSRRVEFVRLTARATTREARLVLRLER